MEASIIESGDFQNLKQMEHGKTEVPLVPAYDRPATAVVWTSLLTGKNPEEHGIYHFTTYKNSFMRYLYYQFLHNKLLIKFLRFSLNFNLGCKVVYDILQKLGIKKRYFKKEDIKTKTLFDSIKPSIAISVPVINEDVLETYGEIGEGKLKETIETSIIQFEKEKLQLYNNLKKPWKFLMVHFMIADVYGHIYYKSIDRITKLYHEFDNLVGDIKRKMGNNALFLIMSDHGTIDDHTDYGFYSSNIPLGLNHPKITEFFNQILKLLKNATVEENNSKQG
jgi:predicted AlkP superfamily pyrophosphatase or phosphodiesterase